MVDGRGEERKEVNKGMRMIFYITIVIGLARRYTYNLSFYNKSLYEFMEFLYV